VQVARRLAALRYLGSPGEPPGALLPPTGGGAKLGRRRRGRRVAHL
jgi:hypothetical protein